MAEEPPKRIVITSESLPPPKASTSAAYGPADPTQPLPPAPPAIAPGGRSLAGSTLGMSVIGAAIAVLPAWGIAELIYTGVEDLDNAMVSSAIWVAAIGAVFGAIYSAWPDAFGRVWERAGIAALLGLVLGGVVGAIAGALAQKVYESLLDGPTMPSDTRFYISRMLAWGIFGLFVGAAVGAAQRMPKKILFGLLGGVIGGALGGLVFQAIGEVFGPGIPGPLLRLLGIAVVLMLIGLGVGLVETGLRQAWITVVAGGMTGKEFVLWQDAIDIGSSPKCQITLIKDPTVAPYHCRIQTNGSLRRLLPFQGAAVTVNGRPVTEHLLRNGDLIGLGQTALRYVDRT